MRNSNCYKKLMSDDAATSPANQAQSVDRALTILEILARHGEAGVTGIAARLGVHKSTVSRLLSTLEAHRLVEQEGERGRYRLGFGVVMLAGATTAKMDLVREGQAVCRRLAGELNETVNIAVLREGAAVNVSQEQGGAAITAANWIGKRTPLHATSSGKVLLAWADGGAGAGSADGGAGAGSAAGGAVLADVLETGLERYTADTVTDPAALRAELGLVRTRGWAGAAEELEPGLNALAAPVRDASGTVVAALSVSGPSYRLTAGSFHEVAKKAIEAADEISAQLGYSRGSGGEAGSRD